ncbi:MAG: hypothetical protein JXQ23_05825 [Clostridia bacterium]|nr:hypothetical protein [Clostridia bacterium]
MKINYNGFSFEMAAYERDSKEPVPFHLYYQDNQTITYQLDFDKPYDTSVLIEIRLLNEKELFHLIPCNIHGDNNLINARPGYFPNLTDQYPEFPTSSEVWEFRADRASHPVSIITCQNGSIGITVDPYITDSETIIRNGVYAQLPDIAGVSIGYQNRPLTFTNKENMTASTNNKLRKAAISGKIYLSREYGRLSCHKIIQRVYQTYHEMPVYKNTLSDYLNGFLDSYEKINWSDEMNAFTNMSCHLPGDPVLKPWRPLLGIGWTGTSILIYPLLMAQILLHEDNSFTQKLLRLLDEMSTRINPESGLFYDLVRPYKGSDVNGWWAGYLVKDCHCAYTNGNGIYYLLKSFKLMEKYKHIRKEAWLQSALTALDSIILLQKENGNFGYTYSTLKREMLDDKGFAGCWFIPSLALAYEITGLQKYLDSAIKGLHYYHQFVKELTCYGTPMDTYKSIDQEGNLAFIRGARHLHEITKNTVFLKYLEDSANYEYLWRYSFKANPECPPLKGSQWNSCGGSVTSVSNPHIHPMGVTVTSDLLYLYRATRDEYHRERALDGLYWGLQTADLYPSVTGYGKLGVMTERYCPSDGLTVEQYENGEKSSIWFTFNGWASASVLEGLCESVLNDHLDI